MSAVRTPSRRSSALARVPSMGSSFASCFGASTPISPRRMGGHGLLGGQACVNYRRLGFEELEEDENTRIYEKPAQEEEEQAEERRVDGEQKREGPFLHHVAQQLSLEEGGMHDDSEVEEFYAREGETENAKKSGKPWSKREKAGMQTKHASGTPLEVEEPYASEQEGEQCGRERTATRELAKQWSLREKNTIYEAVTPEKQEAREHGIRGEEEEEAVGNARARKGLWKKFGKPWKARREVQSASLEEEIDEFGRERIGDMQHLRMRKNEEGMTPRRESLSRKVREACVQALENARRSSPHLSELFLGNQLLMQVTSSSFTARRAARNVPPSTGFLNAGEPPVSTASPPRSSASSTL